MQDLIRKIIAANKSRARKDINAWRTALQMAERVENPKRNLLYNLYDELELDAHLTAAIQRRVLTVRGADFTVLDANGEPDPEKAELLRRPWFIRFVELAMQSIFWGHSLIQIREIEQGEISGVELVRRRHVRPESGLFVERQEDDKGISYRDDDKYYDWLLEVGGHEDLGLLNKCAPHILYKRFAQASWSEYCEVFGMPLRYGKTNVKDIESLNRMEDMMLNMGTAAYAVIDNDEEVQFVETTGGKGEVYDSLIDKCNAEVSKLINGAVIGEASQGGSRSKEEVGERVGEAITRADKDFIAGYVNHTLIPRLVKLGYPLEGCSFRFERDADTHALWEITQGVLQHYEVDADFITDTFGIPVTGKKAAGQASLSAESRGRFFG